MMSSDELNDKNDNQIPHQIHGFAENMNVPEHSNHYHSHAQASTNIDHLLFANQYATKSLQREETSKNPEVQQKSVQLSKAELRKSNKPIMEKKRRARINHCLNELKTLILEAMKKDPARHTKLEKADILEMTVKYLQNLQRNQTNLTIPNDAITLHRFKDGFSDCTNEVSRYINEMDGVDVNVKRRLMGHLSNCVSHIQHSGVSNRFTPEDNSNPFSLRFNENPSNNFNNNLWAPIRHQTSTNTSHEKSDVPFIPSRLSSGELALIIPNSVNLNYFSSGSFSLNPITASIESTQSTSFGGTTMKRKRPDTSPPLSPTSSISSSDSAIKRTSSEFSSFDSSFQTPPKQFISFTTSSSCNSSFEKSTLNSGISDSSPTMVTTLQQQHVTSTTEQIGKYEEAAAKKMKNSDDDNMWRPW